jgi:dihydroorotase
LGGGTLQPGAPADVIALDIGAKWRVDPARFYSKSHNTPFAGRDLTGAVALTIVGGLTVHTRAAV